MGSRWTRWLVRRGGAIARTQSRLFGLALCFWLGLMWSSAGAAPFTVTDLGTLGGNTSIAMAINDFGQVVGWSNTAGAAFPRAFLWDGTAMRDLGTLGGRYSVAFGIDSRGRVVGVSTTEGDAEYHAFLWDGAAMRDLGTLGGTYSLAYAINDSGHVVGLSTTAGDAEHHAFLWDGAAMRDLGTFGGKFSVATAINSSGLIVGDSTGEGAIPRHAFRFDGSLQDLGTLGGGESRAYGVNSLGQIVGEALTLLHPFPHAFLYDGVSMRDLGTLGGTVSRGYDINDAGSVVGSATVPGDQKEHAFLYAGGRMMDLNRLIPDGSGWVLTQAQGINKSGQIVGSGVRGSLTRAFLLAPTGVEPLPPPPPGAPEQLTTTVLSFSTIALSWKDTAADETGFQIERSTEGGPFTTVAVVGVNQSQYKDQGLTPKTRYTYRVRAIRNENASDFTNESSGITPSADPAAPTGLAATAISNHQVRLTWIDNSSNETAFAIWRRSGDEAWTRVAVAAADATSLVDTGLSSGTTYIYRIRATNNFGTSAWTQEVLCTTLAVPPAPPAGLQAVPVSEQRIDLFWIDLSANESGFEIWRRVDSEPFQWIATLGPDLNRYSDEGLSPDHRYSYRVRAVNTSGASPWTQEVGSFVLLPAPAAPGGLTATPISGQQIDLSWTDNSSHEFAFAIWRRTGNSDWERLAVVAPNVTRYSDRSASQGVLYTYRVRTTNNGGASAWSSEVSSYSVLPAPEPPTGLSAQVVAPQRIELAWTDHSVDELGFTIWRKTEGTEFAWVGVVPANETRFEDSALAPEQAYTYRVRATNNGGPSGWSEEVTVRTPPIPPAPPTNLRFRVAGPGQITFSWVDNSRDESSYEVYRKVGATDWVRIALLSANSELYTDVNIAPTTLHCYRVRAVGPKGVSDWSNEIAWMSMAAP